MARPDSARRVKTYSSATGTVFQYYFFEVEAAVRDGKAGREYRYMVSADRKASYPLHILVEAAAVETWNRRAGGELSGTEEYAVAKLRLFQAFDEDESLAEPPAGRTALLFVEETNLEDLVKQLDPERFSSPD